MSTPACPPGALVEDRARGSGPLRTCKGNPYGAAYGGALRPSLDRTMTGPLFGTQVGKADLVESTYDQEKGSTQCKPSQ